MNTYKYNYENATEKRESQKQDGRLDIPHDDPSKHPEHLTEHEMLQEIQREALYGKPERVKELLLKFPESKREDLSTMLQKSAAEKGKILEL